MKIRINHIAKIEGHAGFYADLINGDIRSARMRIVQGVRLVEGLVVGRDYKEAPIVTSRICGICSVAHNLTSIKAIEAALGIRPMLQAVRLRKLLGYAEFIQSHAAHVFFLSLADFFQTPNDLDLIRKFPKLTEKVVKIRDLGNEIKDVVGGRDIHLLTSIVGGFSKVPDRKAMVKLITEADECLDYAAEFVEFLQKLYFPEYERKIEFVGLVPKNEYNFYDGEIKTFPPNLTLPHKGGGKGKRETATQFYKRLKEEQRMLGETVWDPVKEVKANGKPIMVGALARLNLNAKNLNPLAKKYLKFLGKLPNFNTYLNIYSQAVEIVHSLAEVKRLIKEYLAENSDKVFVQVELKNGHGIGATEAPRGTLYHEYEVDKYGVIRQCNIITPTAQLLPSMENDLRRILSEMGRLTKKARRHKILMMIRAYDPCMTCAVQ